MSVCLCMSLSVSVWSKNYISKSDRFINTLSSAKAQDYFIFFFILFLLLFTICCWFRCHCCRNASVVGPTATCKHSKDVDHSESHQSSSINIRIHSFAFTLIFTVTFTVTVSVTITVIFLLLYLYMVHIMFII